MTSTLHVINRKDRGDYDACLNCLQAGDAILFIEDAAYLLLETTFGKRDVVQTLDNCPHFALGADLVARGISARIPPQVMPVDYAGFVELSLRHDRVINW